MNSSLDDIIQQRTNPKNRRWRFKGQSNDNFSKKKFDARQKISQNKFTDAREKLQSRRSLAITDARQKIQQKSKLVDARTKIQNKTSKTVKPQINTKGKIDARQFIKSRGTPATQKTALNKAIASTKVLVTNNGRSLMRKTGATTAVGSGGKGQLIKTVQHKPWRNKPSTVEVVMSNKSQNSMENISFTFNNENITKQVVNKPKPLLITTHNNTSQFGQPSQTIQPLHTTSSLLRKGGGLYSDVNIESQRSVQSAQLVQNTYQKPLTATYSAPIQSAWSNTEPDSMDVDFEIEADNLEMPLEESVKFNHSNPMPISINKPLVTQPAWGVISQQVPQTNISQPAQPALPTNGHRTNTVANIVSNSNNMYSTKIVQNDNSKVTTITKQISHSKNPAPIHSRMDCSGSNSILKDSEDEEEDKDAQLFSQGYKILITDLHDNVSQNDIVELFGIIGKIKKATLLENGTGEVIYLHKKDALKAIFDYHRRELDGVPMKVQMVNNVPEPKKAAVSDVAKKPPKAPPKVVQQKVIPAPSIDIQEKSLKTLKTTITQETDVEEGTGPLVLYGKNPTPKMMSKDTARIGSKEDIVDVALVHRVIFKKKQPSQRPVTFTVKV